MRATGANLTAEQKSLLRTDLVELRSPEFVAAMNLSEDKIRSALAESGIDESKIFAISENIEQVSEVVRSEDFKTVMGGFAN